MSGFKTFSVFVMVLRFSLKYINICEEKFYDNSIQPIIYVYKIAVYLCVSERKSEVRTDWRKFECNVFIAFNVMCNF